MSVWHFAWTREVHLHGLRVSRNFFLAAPFRSRPDANAYGKLQPMQIGELLIREGHLTQEGLEEALDWQVLYGGRLGTNLLELRLVEEKHLAEALGRQLGCETAWGDLELPPEMIGIIPNHVADRQEMMPWKLEKRRLKVLCTEIKLEQLDQLGYKLGHACIPVVAPEFRIFNLLRAHYKATRQMRALDFGVVPEEGRRRRKPKQEKPEVAAPAPELIDEAEFNNIYNNVLAGRGAAPKDMPVANWAPPLAEPSSPPPSVAAPPSVTRATPTALAAPPPSELETLESLPEDAILGELPAEAIDAAAEPPSAPLKAVHWEETPTRPPPARDESPLAFDEALRLLEGVVDRDSIAHVVLRASRSKAARALLMTVQGGVALGWDGIGPGLGGPAARAVAVPLTAQSAFQLVVKTRSHFMGPLQKTPSNIRFLAATGKQIPFSSLLFPILYRGRVSHLLYLDNGHKQQAPTDVGEMLILMQRITQSVEALVERKRKAKSAKG
jgi:hypothetical protein